MSKCSAIAIVLTVFLAVCFSPPPAAAADEPLVKVRVIEYPGLHKPDGMWSGLYVASSGKVYSGLCTHGGSAVFYEYDPATDNNRLVAEIGVFLGDNGKGERSHNKIHTRFAEDAHGNIYFATGNQGGGPSRIDPMTWVEKGSNLFRYDPSSGKLEVLGRVTRNWGSYGLVLDKKREIAYLTCWDNHLRAFDINKRVSRDLGRVNNWDVNRMIAIDDLGNVYGTFTDHYIWKYDVEADRLYDLPVRIPFQQDLRPIYHHGKPAMDRRNNWRYAEWEPTLRKIYGIECGRSLLFEYDPFEGEHGRVRLVADMALQSQIDSNEHPYATLGVGFAPNQVIYYAIVDRVFDYGAAEHETRGQSNTYLQSCDLKTGRKQIIGIMVTTDGRKVLGTGACEVAANGKVYFCGAVSEPDPDRVVGKAAGIDPYRLQLLVWDPAAN